MQAKRPSKNEGIRGIFVFSGLEKHTAVEEQIQTMVPLQLWSSLSNNRPKEYSTAFAN